MPSLPLLSGRSPRRDDEVVFGAETLKSLGAHVGSRISVLAQSTRRELHIVGTAVFPRFAPYPGSEPTGLGIGAETTAHAIQSMKAQFGPTFVLVQLHSHAHISPE